MPEDILIRFRSVCRFCDTVLRATSEAELSRKCAAHLNLRHPTESTALAGLAQVFTGLLLRRYFKHHSSPEERVTILALKAQMHEIISGTRTDLDHEVIAEIVRENKKTAAESA